MTAGAWLWRHLETTGAMGPDRIGRGVRATACRQCRRPTLTALDADMAAGVARCDPAPVSALGEALALVAGRSTYALRRTAGRYELDTRDQWQIKGRPASNGHFDVLAAHRCNSAPLPELPSVYTKPKRTEYANAPF